VTPEENKVQTTLLVHAEATDDTSFTRKVRVFQDESVTMKVHDLPLVSDGELVDAQVVDAMGGFAIMLKFNASAKRMLDYHTSMNIGRHLAIFVLFGEKPTTSRWIAAPIISSRISDGMLIFTPDCTRLEADKIVAGLQQEKKPEGTNEGKSPELWHPADL